MNQNRIIIAASRATLCCVIAWNSLQAAAADAPHSVSAERPSMSGGNPWVSLNDFAAASTEFNPTPAAESVTNDMPPQTTALRLPLLSIPARSGAAAVRRDSRTHTEESPFRQNSASLQIVADGTPQSLSEFGSAEDLSGMVWRIVRSTAIVLIGCVVCIPMLKKFGPNAAAERALAQRQMRIVESCPVGGKAAIHLVEVDRQRLVVATDTGGIQSVVPLNGSFADALKSVQSDIAPSGDSHA